MRIFCDYCEQPFEIKEDELDDWITLDPSDGSKVVMCPQCESRLTQRAADGVLLAQPQNDAQNEGDGLAAGNAGQGFVQS